MNYLKSAIAGIGVSIISTSLCGSKVGEVINFRNVYTSDNWFNRDFSKWSVTKALLINNGMCIPSAILGAAFHDNLSHDLTKGFNSCFGTNINPYLMTGSVFTGIGAIGMFLTIKFATLSCITQPLKDLTQPLIYSPFYKKNFIILLYYKMWDNVNHFLKF
jgi:hypothetical protein